MCFAQIFISGIYGRDGKPSLTCQRTPSATMAPYRGASRYLRCGVRLQEEHGALQAKSNRLNAFGLCGNREARTRASGPGELESNDSTRLNQSPRKEHCRGLLQNHSSKLRGKRDNTPNTVPHVFGIMNVSEVTNKLLSLAVGQNALLDERHGRGRAC